MIKQQKNTWRGNTDVDLNSDRLTSQNRISRYFIINKSVGNVTFSVLVGTDIDNAISITNKDSILAPGEGYTDGGIVVESRDIIHLICNGEVDFCFLFDYTYPDGQESKIKPNQTILINSGFTVNSRIIPE